MLTELTIRNFAIIDELRIHFAEGLNIITGETGAGKSIIIGAVNLLLGDRASGDMIRTSEDTATVEAFFDLNRQEPVIERLEEWGLGNGQDLVIKRVISRSGKNRVYINGSAATLAMLSDLGESLLNICGQHEHQILLKEEHHIDMLDAYAGLWPLRRDYEDTYREVQAAQARVSQLESLNRNRLDREEFIRYQLREMTEVDPKAGEDENLMDERKILSSVQQLSDYAVKAYTMLYDGDGAVLEKMQTVMDAVREIRRIDQRLNLPEEDLTAQYYQLEEMAFLLRDYAKGLTFDPGRLESIDDRLERLGRLKRKHGGALEDVLTKKEEMETELRQIQSVDEELNAERQVLAEALHVLTDKGDELSRRRRASATELQRGMEAQIQALRMPGARFEVIFGDDLPAKEGNRYGASGKDDIRFYLSTNPGEALKPLSRVASGGELSRIVLAMKKVLAGTGFAGTIVFDEVDSGIGGATAEIVGKKIREVAGHHQVLCITHLPQIACFANRHYRVSKQVSAGKTTTAVELLSERERQEEMARMLGGVDVTETTRRHAQEMLKVASQDPLS